MKFCNTCNNILFPIENNKLRCGTCDTIIDGELVSKEKIAKKPKKHNGIIHEEFNPFATYPHKCKKCGFDKAQIIQREPYITDEDSLLYLKCGKCGFSENMARKIM
ncbi:MAG: hypothetical protein Q8N99_05290 [Nanoarchaeota archaeon]|nr:hypothetical protein [Nanoarchaeota archaeon]